MTSIEFQTGSSDQTKKMLNKLEDQERNEVAFVVIEAHVRTQVSYMKCMVQSTIDAAE